MSLKNQNSKKVGKVGGIQMVSKTPRPVRKRFEKVASEIKSKMQSAGISGIVYTGIKEGDFSGGMVGDVEVIAETLLIACKRNAGLFHLLDIVVRATKDSGFHQEDEVNRESVQNAVEIAKESEMKVGEMRRPTGDYPKKIKEAIEGGDPSKKVTVKPKK